MNSEKNVLIFEQFITHEQFLRKKRNTFHFRQYVLTMPSHEFKKPRHDCHFNLIGAFLFLRLKNVIEQNHMALFYMFQVRT